MRVYVYWNLHKGGFSIKALEGAAKGKVIAHACTVMIEEVTFKVSEGGRQRSIAKHKEVHAGMQGRLVSFVGPYTPIGATLNLELETVIIDSLAIARDATPITYNPHRCATFVRRTDGSAIHDAAAVIGFTVDGRADCYAREWA